VSGSEAGYTPSWYTATAVPGPERAPLADGLDVDVCVVGAGLAGLTTAREIARRGWSVAVVESGRIAANASGRNCGFVLPGFAANIRAIVERVGLERARELWALSEAGLEYVRATVRETGMPGVDPLDGWLNVSKQDDAEGILATRDLLAGDLGVEVEGWTTERVREVLKSERYFGALHFARAFHLHPLNYALGLAAAAEAAGAHIFEHTPALAIDPAGVRKRIDTPQGRLRAAQVVLAGNVYIGELMPRVAATVRPVWTCVATTAPLGPRLAEAITFGGAISEGEGAGNQYRIVAGDRLLISGRPSAWEADPRRLAGKLAADIGRLYPQLGALEVEQRWSAVLGRTIHGMPQIGELSPGIWLASGFGEQGLNTTAMAGTLIARAIVENDDTWRLFLPFELIWAGGLAGRVAAQAGYWWNRAAAERKAQKARRRKLAGERSAPALPATEWADRAASPETPSRTQPDAPAAAAMEPADAAPALDSHPSPLNPASDEEQPTIGQRPSLFAMTAGRSSR
jgi:glycine/D-amino acid oxidase-like deaminating enzyme